MRRCTGILPARVNESREFRWCVADFHRLGTLIDKKGPPRWALAGQGHRARNGSSEGGRARSRELLHLAGQACLRGLLFPIRPHIDALASTPAATHTRRERRHREVGVVMRYVRTLLNADSRGWRHGLAIAPRRERAYCERHCRTGQLFGFHSMTSSARTSNICGTSRPNAFAAWRLITNSYLVGACTGRSAGLVPLRMRSTYEAERRTTSKESGP